MESKKISQLSLNWFEQKENICTYLKFESDYLELPRKLFIEIALGLPQKPIKRVLDIGCGTGSVIEYLKHILPESEFCGIDPSKAMVHEAKKLLKNSATIFQCDCNSIPIDIGKFDLIISHSNFRFWKEPIAGLQKINELLNLNGAAYILDLRKDISVNIFKEITSQITDQETINYIKQQIDSAYTTEQILNMITQSNLQNISLGVGGLAGLPFQSYESLRLLQKNKRIAEIIFTILKNGFKNPISADSIVHIFLNK